ncbi:unnamed protein product [Clonostachys chloroleuca]|uniref:Uncharacterized protein n=1 Tax=Clonostachys chloroleuca TaxID=1926264 RepID=A0AA35MIB5_9HYPO|nr:unnamed protein product [Clonostachys chloroleuca]
MQRPCRPNGSSSIAEFFFSQRDPSPVISNANLLVFRQLTDSVQLRGQYEHRWAHFCILDPASVAFSSLIDIKYDVINTTVGAVA